MHPLNSRTTNTVTEVKNWTFIGRSLKKYLYGIRLINWRAKNYRAKYKERTMVTNSVDIFSYQSHISLFFGFTNKVSKIQRHFILWFRAVSFFYVSSLVTVFLQNTCAHIRSGDPSDTNDTTSRTSCYLYMYVYLWSFYIFSRLL